ncbi:acyl dehydratase [Duganella sp. SG902]|uniref:MaoC/PaaZ C-terminal domain-containing protein n=1 Tax=Duganella sp. SG902 TaxID=2587016 RepID=UPI00159E8DCA|nr:MaoC/PaaZ C-terminal domain-containing protein [Duganella sp. SG902]NVM74320.1 acyl dehydratase [Duganella sp. SG902]
MSALPYGLLRHQMPMLMTGARVFGHTLFHALLPSPGPSRTDGAETAAQRLARNIAPVTRVIAAPRRELVEHYIAWAGAAHSYDGLLPPHMVSQWSLPLVGELLLRMPYRLTGVINQGVGLRAHGPLPRDVPLHLRASVERIEETPGRIKVVVTVITGTAQAPTLVEANLHMSFLLPGPRAPKTSPERAPEPDWITAGLWHAEADDGLRFALLTGDFNPIHWCGPVARRSVFRGMVLHGFGSFVRSYEVLTRQGVPFDEIDVRFVKPVPLPCTALSVQVAPEASTDTQGWRALRLAGASDAVHLAGRLR